MHPFDPTPHIERIPDAADVEPVVSPFDMIASAVCILGALAVIGIMLWVAIDGARGASRLEMLSSQENFSAYRSIRSVGL